ncbi:hypothetical protein HK099_001593, partial [Clydaea vesicula]
EIPTDNRSKVIKELLITERKYVADLEDLQAYSVEVLNNNLLNKNQFYQLFVNLPELLDFQRRFLLSLEAILALPMEEQKIGSLFVQQEPAFTVYEPFCANYKHASKLILSETNKLSKLSNLIEPSYGLPSYLIKPIQRICKYPLLLRELIKYSDATTYPFIEDLKAGEEAIKRVTQNVNEQKRLEENQDMKLALSEQIIDLKNLSFDDFGDLLLHDKFPMSNNNIERDYQLFLFERIMLCCREVQKKKKKKGKEELPQYSLKGNIFIHTIGGVVDTSKPDLQQFGLQVFWKDGNDMETFALNCRNVEQVSMWMGRLEKLIESERTRQRNVNEGLLNPAVRNRMFGQEDMEQNEPDEDVDFSGAGPRGRPRGRSDAYATAEAAAAVTKLFGNPTSASSPNMARSKSIPRNINQTGFQWDNPPPPVPQDYMNRKSTPAAPRGASLQGSQNSIMEGTRVNQRPYSESPAPRGDGRNAARYGANVQSLPANARRPSVNNQSTKEYDDIMASLEQGGLLPVSNTTSSSPKLGRQRPNPISTQFDTSQYQNYNQNAASPTVTNPNAIQQQQSLNGNYQQQRKNESGTPVYRTEAEARMAARMQQAQLQQTSQPQYRTEAEARLMARMQQTTQNSSENRQQYRTEAESRMAARMQQLRVNSTSSLDQQHSSYNIPPPTSPLPAPPRGSNNSQRGSGGSPPAVPALIKVKTHFGSDIFVVAVPSRGCPFQELLSKIERKIRLCGAALPDGRPLQLSYRDKDGDFCLIKSNVDVGIAFEIGAENGV